nr:uncharacterized protein LOC112012205 [Quercus suber]
MGDSYQPSYGRRHDGYSRDQQGQQRDYYDSYSRPATRRPYDEFPRSPPRHPNDYHQSHNHRAPQHHFAFRGAANQQSRNHDPRDSYRPPPEFTFRAQNGSSAPLFPPSDHYQPADTSLRGGRPRRGGRGKVGSRGRGAYNGAHGNGTQRFVGGFRSKPAHNRAILREAGRSSTPEQLAGMNQVGAARFRDAESTEDDDSSAMAISSDDEPEDGAPPNKRIKSSVPPINVVPKWSNPDPYTALPPPESLGAPKKDIVHVIRKAKINAAPQDSTTNAVKENVDFISFDFGEDEDEDEDDDDDGHSVRGVGEMEDGELEDSNGNIDAANANQHGHSARRSGPSNDAGYRSAMQISDAANEASPSVGTGEVASPAGYEMVMPPDRELADQYGGLDDLVNRLDDANNKRGKKRKHESEFKARHGTLGSSVTKEWRPDQSNATPWFAGHRRPTHDGKDRLHDEIQDFFDFTQPRSYEAETRYDLINRIERAVRASRSGSYIEIRCFGSFASGMYLPTADMDLVAVSPGYLRGGRPTFNSKNIMYGLKRHLENTGVATLNGVVVVARAKVPVVKFVDRVTGIKVDISFENMTGVTAVDTLVKWKQDFPAMPVLVVLIKQFLAMRGLNEVFSGGIGGFTIICLVTSMMQHARDIPVGPTAAELHYGELLMRFLDRYGSGKPDSFDIDTTGIMMNPPELYDKWKYPLPKQNPNRLTIVDPNKPDNDISGGSSQVRAVFDLFRHAHTAIQRHIDQDNAGEADESSILDCILGGNYALFAHQRQKLSLLHRGRSMSPVATPLLASNERNGKHTQTEKRRHKHREQTREVHTASYDAQSHSDDPDATYVPRDFTPINGPSSNSCAITDDFRVVRELSTKASAVNARAVTHKDSTQGEEVVKHRKQQPTASQADDGDVKRAAEFRKQFPNVPNVPDTLTREQWKKLRAIQVASLDKQRARTFKSAHPELADQVPDAVTKAQLRGFNQQFSLHGKGQRKGQKNRAKKQLAKVKARSAGRKAGQS